MTRISYDRNLLVRETRATYRGKELMVRLDTHTCDIKLKGQRWTSAYSIPWVAVFHLGAKLKARDAKAGNRRSKGRKLPWGTV